MLDLLVLGALGYSALRLRGEGGKHGGPAPHPSSGMPPHAQTAPPEQFGLPWPRDTITPANTVLPRGNLNAFYFPTFDGERPSSQLDPAYLPGTAHDRVLGNLSVRPNAEISRRIARLRADVDFADELEGPPALNPARHSPEGGRDPVYDAKYTKFAQGKAGLETVFSRTINTLVRGDGGGTWFAPWAWGRAAEADDDVTLDARADPRFMLRRPGGG